MSDTCRPSPSRSPSHGRCPTTLYKSGSQSRSGECPLFSQQRTFPRPRLTSVVVKGCRTSAVARRLPRARSAGVGQASGEETAGRDGRGVAAGYGDLTAGCGRRRFGGRDAVGLRHVGANNRSTSEQVLAPCRRDRRAWRGGKPDFARALWWPVGSRRYERAALSRWNSGIVVMGWRSRSRRSAARVVRCRVRRSR